MKKLILGIAIISVIVAMYTTINITRVLERSLVLHAMTDANSPSVEVLSASAPTTIVSPSHCQFREFPFPEIHTGLPYLFDAFADPTSEHAVFLGVHRRQIFPKFADSDSFFTSDPENDRTHHFLCMFQGELPVWSEAVHPTGFGSNAFPYAHERNFLIRCKIPFALRNLIVAGQRDTRLLVDLVALLHPSNKTQVKASHLISELPTIPNIPICHSTSNADNPNANFRPNQFTLVGYTQIRSTYTVSKKETVSEVYRVHEWIHYHQYQGVQHFVIYDNDIQDHGPVETELKPYIEKGIVTRIWNPKNETIPVDSRTGKIKTHMQASMGNAALLRYGFIAKYFLSCDIDEYFIPSDPEKKVLNIMDEYFTKKPLVDGLKWMPYVVTYCNGTILDASLLEKHGNGGPLDKSQMATKKCRTRLMIKGEKLTFYSDRIWFYHTHNAFLTSAWTKPIMDKLPFSTGYLGHYRRESYDVTPLGDGKIMILHDHADDDPSMTNLDRYLQAREAERY